MFILFDENENIEVVPGFEQTIKPLLIALQNIGGEASIEVLDEETIKVMGLSSEVVQIRHKGSTRQSEISYRMAWARTYLKKYGLIKNESRGIWSFTDKFDGDIEKIDVDEIVRKVRNENNSNGEEKQLLTGFESVLAFENMVGALLEDLAEKEGKKIRFTYFDYEYENCDILLPEGIEDCKKEIR